MTQRDRRGSYDDVLAHVAAKRRKRRSIERRRSRRSVIVTILVTIGVGMFLVAGAGAVAGAIFVHDTLAGVSLDTLKADPPGINSEIYDRNGNLLETISSTENRTPVPSDKISPWLKTATVDIEDKRFYEHGGVDYVGIARAFLDDIQAGHAVQGASTIEQHECAGDAETGVRAAQVHLRAAGGLATERLLESRVTEELWERRQTVDDVGRRHLDQLFLRHCGDRRWRVHTR